MLSRVAYCLKSSYTASLPALLVMKCQFTLNNWILRYLSNNNNNKKNNDNSSFFYYFKILGKLLDNSLGYLDFENSTSLYPSSCMVIAARCHNLRRLNLTNCISILPSLFLNTFMTFGIKTEFDL